MSTFHKCDRCQTEIEGTLCKISLWQGERQKVVIIGGNESIDFVGPSTEEFDLCETCYGIAEEAVNPDAPNRFNFRTMISSLRALCKQFEDSTICNHVQEILTEAGYAVDDQ